MLIPHKKVPQVFIEKKKKSTFRWLGKSAAEAVDPAAHVSPAPFHVPSVAPLRPAHVLLRQAPSPTASGGPVHGGSNWMSPAPHASVSFLTQAFLESVPFSLELTVCSHQECAHSPRVAVFRPPESSLRSGPWSPSTDGWGPVGGRMHFCTCGLRFREPWLVSARFHGFFCNMLVFLLPQWYLMTLLPKGECSLSPVMLRFLLKQNQGHF